jgi:hypothetical protein
MSCKFGGESAEPTARLPTGIAKFDPVIAPAQRR